MPVVVGTPDDIADQMEHYMEMVASMAHAVAT